MGKLFKGKRCDNGEMVEGYLLQTAICTYIIPPNQGREDPELFEVMPETVKSCNGKDVS